MAQVIMYIILGLVLAAGCWQLAVWMFEIRDKNRKYRAAYANALACNKPLLVVGGPWGGKKYRHWINKPAHGSGDVCIDIDPKALTDHPKCAVASVTCLPFTDKAFGGVFASHILEHLPTVADARKALDELYRVADNVFLVYPSRQSIGGWITAGHHLWIWQKGKDTYIRQRGPAEGEMEYRYRAGN